MTLPLWHHQELAVQYAHSRWDEKQNGVMLAMAMGTGKTPTAIQLALDDKAEQLLIVCPLRVVQVWEQQLARFAPGHFHVLALDDRVASVQDKFLKARDLFEWSCAHSQPVAIIVNYDSARLHPFGEWATGRLWSMVIADEVHRCKEPRGRTSKWLAKLGLVAQRRLGLTGTPMPHIPIDIWGQFRFLNPFHLDPSYSQFKSRYAIMGGFFNKEIVGWRDLDDLERRFRQLAFRVDDSVLDLPPVMYETRATDMDKEGARIYREMAGEMIAQVQEGIVTASNALVRLLRLAQITGGSIEDETGKRHQIDTAKEELLLELLMDLREPVVVFYRFRADLEAVRRAATRAFLNSLELSGEHNELKDWQQTSEPSVLAVQIQAGGVGVDLTRARIAIYYSLDFSLANYLQSRKRIHRPPQSRPCVFYHLQIRHSIDEYILRAIEARRDLVDSVLGENDLVKPVLEELKTKRSQNVGAD